MPFAKKVPRLMLVVGVNGVVGEVETSSAQRGGAISGGGEGGNQNWEADEGEIRILRQMWR
eukprot:529249-Ditylum_brightwellii.AAC.1